jgi:arabinose-5-phosphate isomerase
LSHLAKAREVFDIELAALKAVRAQLDQSFDAAVETIIAALKQRGKIVIVGIGKSGNVGAKIAATLTSPAPPPSCSTAWTRCTATWESSMTAT